MAAAVCAGPERLLPFLPKARVVVPTAVTALIMTAAVHYIAPFYGNFECCCDYCYLVMCGREGFKRISENACSMPTMSVRLAPY